MSAKNKFGFGPIDPPAAPEPRERSVGPMGAAVREAAGSLQDSTDAKVEQRRKNAEDAKAFRTAQGEGRLLVAVSLEDVQTTDLPRDRLDLAAVAASDEMEELKASIRERGQKEPVELYRDADGGLQLKKGWRRFTALSQLFQATGDAAFSTVMARIEDGNDDRMSRYIDMVEENVVREDLTFAEMAQVAILAASDTSTDEADPDAIVLRLYGSLHKMKRSYIRSFVFLLLTLGDALKFPKAVSRNLGADVARALKGGEDAKQLRTALLRTTTDSQQSAVLHNFLKKARSGVVDVPKKDRKEKREFHVGDMKVTARNGECRIVSPVDFTSIPKGQLEVAIAAFEAALRKR
jgi:ParB family chromosome partitioning protein